MEKADSDNYIKYLEKDFADLLYSEGSNYYNLNEY